MQKKKIERNLDIVLKPVKSLEDFIKLEERLKDSSYAARLIDSMVYICGDSGKAKGIDSCYKLVDCFVDRQFLQNCSWTGNSRNTESTKVALKYFEKFRHCFLNIVLRSDKDFSEAELDKFFKNILRNSKQRSNVRNIINLASENRPQYLAYTKSLYIYMT